MKSKAPILKKKVVVKKTIAKKKSPVTKVLTLKVGNKVPSFSLTSSNGGVVSSRLLLGSRYVLYFYPKDMTSGCTVEAHEFSALGKKFAKIGLQIFGISPDSILSHLKFIEKDNITFPLLADVGHGVAEAFGVWVEKSMYGKKYMGINRSTFIIDADGKIEAIYTNVKPEGHAVCVLGDVEKEN